MKNISDTFIMKNAWLFVVKIAFYGIFVASE